MFYVYRSHRTLVFMNISPATSGVLQHDGRPSFLGERGTCWEGTRIIVGWCTLLMQAQIARVQALLCLVGCCGTSLSDGHLRAAQKCFTADHHLEWQPYCRSTWHIFCNGLKRTPMALWGNRTKTWHLAESRLKVALYLHTQTNKGQKCGGRKWGLAVLLLKTLVY